MQNYVLAMFVQMKYFITKITFHNFIVDTELVIAKKGDGTDQRKKVLLQTYAWRQISNYIHQSDEQFIAANGLEKKYAATMDAFNLSYTPHSTRFLKLLKENVPDLNDSKLHGVNYVSIREKTGKDAEELLNSYTLHDMMERISKAIRIKLKNVKNVL